MELKLDDEKMFDAISELTENIEEFEGNISKQLYESEINLLNCLDYYHDKLDEVEDRLAIEISDLKESIDWEIFELREMIRQLQEMIERKAG